jgi:hypothetical protein
MDMVPVLLELGLEGLRQRGDEITGLCPMHEKNLGRPDRHASWGINTESGLHQCFSCGYKGTLTSLYFDLTGTMPGPELISEMVLSQLMGALPSEHEDYDQEDEEALEDWEPGELVPVNPRRLARRYITPGAAEEYGVCWDKDAAAWFIPIMAPDGELMGAQYKSIDFVLNKPDDMEKSLTLFGLYQAVQSGAEQVAIVESPLDVVRMSVAKVPAVASFGVYVSEDQVKLLNRHFRLVVRALDNDDAGYKADPILEAMLHRRGCPSLAFDYRGLVNADGDPAKDPGDVADNDALAAAWRRSCQVVRLR